MGRIGVALTHTGHITPRESGQTSTGSLVTRNLMGTQVREFVEQGAAARTAGASLREPAATRPADPLIEHPLVAGLGCVSCFRLLGSPFHPRAAELPPLAAKISGRSA